MLDLKASELLDKLSYAHSGTHPKPFVPFLSKVLLHSDGETLTARSFNTVCHSSVVIARGLQIPAGQIVVDMSTTVSNLSKVDGEVTMAIDFDSPQIAFKSGRTKWSELGEQGDMYFVLPTGLPETEPYEFDLTKAFKSAEAAIDPKTAFDTIKGIHIKSGETLDVVGTDNHSIAVSTMETGLPLFNGHVTVPTEAAGVMRALFSKGGTELGISKTHVVARGGDFWCATTVTYGQYPDYRRVLIDEASQNTMIVPRKDILRALDMSSPYTDPHTRGLFLKVVGIDGEAFLRVQGAGKMTRGKTVIDVPCITDLTGVSIKVDFKRLKKALTDLAGEDEILLVVDDPVEPRRLVIKPTSADADDRLTQISLLNFQAGDAEVIA